MQCAKTLDVAFFGVVCKNATCSVFYSTCSVVTVIYCWMFDVRCSMFGVRCLVFGVITQYGCMANMEISSCRSSLSDSTSKVFTVTEHETWKY